MKKFFKTFLKMKYNSFVVVYLFKRVSPPISPQRHFPAPKESHSKRQSPERTAPTGAKKEREHQKKKEN